MNDRSPLLSNRSRLRSYGADKEDEESSNQNFFHTNRKSSLRVSETVDVGSLNVLSTKYESLDYDICENEVLLAEEDKKGYSYYVHKTFARWIIFLFIGIFTAVIGAGIDISIDLLSVHKFSLIKKYIDHCKTDDCLYKPYLIWVGYNVGFVAIGAVLVAYIEPVAGGSGIPQVKCYLNGVKIPRIVRIKTLIVKAIGVVSTVVGGLAGGKEGPMIHAGAVVAAGISQGKSTSLRTDFKILEYFREDHEKRDFVSGGAAAGVAAAFGAPVGGVLFSLEEGSSFWNQSLTWRIFFASSVSTLTLNILLSTYHGHPGELTYYGLLNFGHFDNLNYELFELFLYALMGVIGGLLGSLYIRARYLKVIEACLVAAISATVALVMIYSIDDCKPLGQDPTENPLQMYCNDGEYSAIASIWLQVPEASVRSLFHDPPSSHNISTLVLFVITYLILSIWTYGLSVSAGIFIPCLVTGAAWGRIAGIIIGLIVPNATWVDPGKYALVGAAAQLGGVVRMTISLTIILIEATGNLTFGLPLMITLMTAKWGFYDIHIQLARVPLLAWEPPPLTTKLRAREIMSYPVLAFEQIESVRNIVEALTSVSFNGFPIVEYSSNSSGSNNHSNVKSQGRLRGLILRSQLIVLLQHKVYEGEVEQEITIKYFRDEYPRSKDIKEISILPEEMDKLIDLRPYMNPSPYTVQDVASLPRVFRLFRALGLRHLIVVNDGNELVGMVTRKDLARYREFNHFGRIGMEVLKFSNNP